MDHWKLNIIPSSQYLFLSCEILSSEIEAFEITILEVAIASKLSTCSVPISQTYSHSKDILSAYPGPIKGQLEAFGPLTTLQCE